MSSANNRSWNNIGDYVRVGTLLVQGEIIGGASSTTVTTPGFIYTAGGAENPAGFPVAFPSGPRLGKPYVAVVQYESGAVDFVLCSAPPASYADGQIMVKTSAQLAAGDKLAVIIQDA